jgi:hypothetical protein
MASMNRKLLVLVTVAALALAGCIGGGGEDAGTSTDPGASDADDPDTSPPADENETSTDEPEPQPTWENETREGSVDGASAGPFAVFSSEEPFDVADGTLNLTLAISTSEGELSINVYPPCEDDGVAGTGLLADCPMYEFTTEGGNATWGTDDPESGSWTAYVFRQNDGAGQVPYQLTIAELLPPEG